MAENEHPRLILHNFLSLEECKELEFIHKSSSTVGYRPNVFSTTLSHLVATNIPQFIMPFVPIRERLKEKVEEFFGCEFELFVEFTGLISWTRGANIGWHSDDNRSYLKQRDFTAVCYLNSYEKDFKGGLFHFQDGEPTTLIPMAGDVVIYTADSRNTHSVDEIIEGERLTLALWFSRDSSHDEDAKLISLLSEKELPVSKKPIPASMNMYWFSSDLASHQQSGFDICCARMHVLGFDIYPSKGSSLISDYTEILLAPLQLSRGNELFKLEFFNILHALQVIQFYAWKDPELLQSQSEQELGQVFLLLQSEQQIISDIKSLFLKDRKLVETVFGCVSCNSKHSFDWAKISAAYAALEDYSFTLLNQLQRSMPFWRSQMIIYDVPC